jgi:hypothetical protein
MRSEKTGLSKANSKFNILSLCVSVCVSLCLSLIPPPPNNRHNWLYPTTTHFSFFNYFSFFFNYFSFFFNSFSFFFFFFFFFTSSLYGSVI